MKKLLLSLLAVAGAWTSASAQSEIPGYVYHNTVETMTLNQPELDHVSGGKFVYTNKNVVTFTLEGNANIEFLGDKDNCLNLNHGTNFTFSWELSSANYLIKVSDFSLKSAAYMAGAVSLNGGEEVSIATNLFGFDKSNAGNYKTASISDANGLQNNISIVYTNLGLTDQYICYISCTYDLEYYTLDFTEFDKAYNEVAAIYRTLSPEEQADSELGKAFKAAEAFRNANDGAIDVVNGTTPAQVDEETEKLRALLYTANISDGADMTFCIKNNSFEMGDLTAWTVSSTAGNDTKVYQNSGNHATSQGDGTYLFNTYNKRTTNASGLGSTNYDFYEGHRLSQTITGLPNGTYKVSALFSSDHENTTYLTINGVINKEGVQSPNKDTFAPATATVEVTDGTLTIGAIGGEKTIQGKKPAIGGSAGDKFTYNTWYRADNFQLTLLQPEIYRLSETVDYVKPESERKKVILKKEMKAGKYSAVCLPFDYTPSDWTVYKFSNEEEKDNGSTLAITLEKFTGTLTAGRPYFVCPDTDVTEIQVDNVTLIDEPEPIKSYMPLVGVFEATPLNAGDIYVSTTANEMTFKYLKAGATATLKPYRAYFKNNGVSASTFRVNTEDNSLTSILDVINEQQNAGTYDLNGRRTNSLKAGVYVVNGKKVIIK